MWTATRESLEHVAALIHQTRPEWDEYLVMVVLGDLAPRVDGTDLAIAALRCAQDTTMLTPKAIGWGRHWRGLDTEPPAVTASAQRCDVCGKTEARCLGERIGVDDDHAYDPVPRR